MCRICHRNSPQSPMRWITLATSVHPARAEDVCAPSCPCLCVYPAMMHVLRLRCAWTPWLALQEIAPGMAGHSCSSCLPPSYFFRCVVVHFNKSSLQLSAFYKLAWPRVGTATMRIRCRLFRQGLAWLVMTQSLLPWLAPYVPLC
jgi:hypothetical protein